MHIHTDSTWLVTHDSIPFFVSLENMCKQQGIIRLSERGGGFALWSVRFFSQEQNFWSHALSARCFLCPPWGWRSAARSSTTRESGACLPEWTPLGGVPWVGWIRYFRLHCMQIRGMDGAEVLLCSSMGRISNTLRGRAKPELAHLSEPLSFQMFTGSRYLQRSTMAYNHITSYSLYMI